MLRYIPVADLRKGLYVIDEQKGQPLRPPLYSVEGYILSNDEPARLLRAGFRDACIDDERTLPQDEEPGTIPDTELVTHPSQPVFKSTVSYHSEFENARRLYAKSIEVAKEIAELIERRSDINLDAAHDLFEDMLASLLRNRNALCSLAKLRDKDEYTFTHCVNVAMFTVTLAKQIGVKKEHLVEMGMAGFFHDIGKMFIPSILLKHPGRLNSEQFLKLKEHPDLGRRYLCHYPNLPQLVRQGARDHHERHDGQGYPLGKKDADISLAGRLLAVADVYDAISSKRCYKEASTPAETLSIMYQTREQDFSPGFVEAFISVMGIYPSGSFVRLSSKYVAVVLEQNEEQPLHPKVVLLVDGFGIRTQHPKIVDLAVHRNLSIIAPLAKLPVELNIEDAIKYAR